MQLFWFWRAGQARAVLALRSESEAAAAGPPPSAASRRVCVAIQMSPTRIDYAGANTKIGVLYTQRKLVGGMYTLPTSLIHLLHCARVKRLSS